jgi:hypothetical protein
MAVAHLDHPGYTRWFHGYGPAKVSGPCPHTTCPHHARSIIAHGPDLRHYTLEQCEVDEGCNGRCRAWHDEYVRTASLWLFVDAGPEAV